MRHSYSFRRQRGKALIRFSPIARSCCRAPKARYYWRDEPVSEARGFRSCSSPCAPEGKDLVSDASCGCAANIYSVHGSAGGGGLLLFEISGQPQSPRLWLCVNANL